VKRYLPECWRRRLAPFLVCLILCPVAPAATFGELYTVSVELSAEARDPRSDAIRRGMGLLLTRITGRQQAAAYPELRELIDNAGGRRYFAGYDTERGNVVRVAFNAFEVNQALERLNMPIWGEERPATLLWLAADFGDGERAELMENGRATVSRAGAVEGVASQPLSEEAEALFDGVAEEILTAADERGLPLVLPRLDAEDRRLVRFADVWGGFDNFVVRASERYGVDAVLIARIVPTGLGPEIRWTVRRGDRRDTLATPRARMGIDWLADEFASELATVGGAQLTFLTIRGVESWARDYSLIQYLERVSIVEQVDIDSITGDEYVLRVAARGDNTQLERILALDGVLARVEDAPGLVFVPAGRQPGPASQSLGSETQQTP
jgi:uncharacterized protein